MLKSIKSRTLAALAVASALGMGIAQADTLEAELLCDNDPREASATCLLITPSTAFESAAMYSVVSESEPIFVRYYAVESGSHLSATGGFEWVLDPPLVSYYLSDSNSSLNAMSDPDVFSDPMFVTYYSIEPAADESPMEILAADESESGVEIAGGEEILIVPVEHWMIVQAY